MSPPLAKPVNRFLCLAGCFATAWISSTGCQPRPVNPPPISISTPAELAAVQALALQQMRPLVLLIAERKVDNNAIAALNSIAAHDKKSAVILAILDISVSRTRATATRFHPVETPLFIFLTPHGVCLSREQPPVDDSEIIRSLVSQRMWQQTESWSQVDANFVRLETAAQKTNRDVAAQIKLADFLVEHQNEYEVVPVLEVVAHSEKTDNAARIRAWARLVQAHFWVGESEKARHEAQDMIAALGGEAPEARAAANFVLGAQDALNVNRRARARQEFEAAVAAAPDSTYGKQAAEALAKLSKGGSAQ